MSERSRRSSKSNWRAKERRLRRQYRGKIAIAVIISLIVGMIGGIIVDKLVLTKPAETVTPTVSNTEAPVVNEPGNLFGNPTETEEPAPEAPQITDEPDEDEFEDFEAFAEEEPEEVDVSDADWGEAFEEDEPSEENEEPLTDKDADIVDIEESETDEAEAADTEETAAEEAAPTLAPGLAVETEAELEAEPAAEEPVEESEEEPVDEDVVEEEAEPTEEAAAEEPVEEPTAEPTEEPTEAPTAEPTPAPEAHKIVHYGDAFTVTTDINPDGTAHTVNDGTDFENVSLTLQVKKYLDFDYYDRTYGNKYNLKGGTAAVVLGITLNGYTGNAPIVPQNFLLITFCDKTGEVTTQGVQIIDAEIAGNVGVAITSDVPATVYKRYYKEEAGGEMTYMVVTTYNNGVKEDYWFEIIIPADMITPAPTADPNVEALTVGSRGDEVVKLQQTLIDAGYLEGTADGVFGSKTAEGVKLMQKQMGMEETGEADPLFLTYLYMEMDY